MTNCIHFSVDDVFEILWELGQGERRSIFEQKYLAFFKELHDRYGCTFSGYCFLEKGGRKLDELTFSKELTDELHDNAGWLKFGFHALDHETAYGKTHFTVSRVRGSYEEAYEDCRRMHEVLMKLCGGAESLDLVPRIHYFAGTTEALCAWRNLGVKGLLSADDDRLPYDLDEAQMLELKRSYRLTDASCMLQLIRTAFRLEKAEDVRAAWNGIPDDARACIEIFTQEYYLEEPSIRQKFEACARLALEEGLAFGFVQDLG